MASPPGGPLHNVLAPMVPYWKAMGVEAEMVPPPFDPAHLNTFDLLHCGWFNIVGLDWALSALLPPMTTNVWHITTKNIPKDQERLRPFSHFIVDSPHTISMLGQMGFHGNVTYAPMVMDRSQVRPLPLPKEFTCGFLGAEEEVRRWRVVRDGAKLADVPCYLLLYRPTRTVQHIQLIDDFYSKVSCYVHPGFIGTDPLTMHEAMACGRPVISTRVSGPHEHIIEGRNGYFFDGSPRDLADKLLKVKEDVGYMSACARVTEHPSPAEVAPRYVEAWRRVLGEQE